MLVVDKREPGGYVTPVEARITSYNVCYTKLLRVDLIAAVEEAAATTGLPVHLDGYSPPFDYRINVIKVTPDPGVIEVNVQPAHSWAEQREITETIYEERNNFV